MGFAQGRFAGKELSELRYQEARVQASQSRYAASPTQENLKAAYAEFRAYAARFQGLTRGFVERGVARQQQQVLKGQTKVLSEGEFEATLAAAKAQGLAAAKTPEERAAVTARYEQIEEQKLAFFDNTTGYRVINGGKVAGPERLSVLRHEYTHQAFASLPDADRAALVNVFHSAKAFKPLKAGVGLAGASDAVVVNELLARWNSSEGKAAEAKEVQQIDGILKKAPANLRAAVDLRTLTEPALEARFANVPYTNLSGDADAIGLSFAEYTGPAEYDFPGAGLFQQKGALSGELNLQELPRQVYELMFKGGREDPVSLFKAMALADFNVRNAALGALNQYGGEAIFIPGKTPEFYLQRLASLPFVAAPPEVRKTYVDAVNAKAKKTSDMLKDALIRDLARPEGEPSRAAWDAVFVGAGPHSQAAVRAFREANPNARVLVIEATDSVSQFSDTGEAFYVNSGAYQDTGEPARPSAGVGDLNPLNGPALVTDMQALKYAKGRDIGDAAAINLEIAGPDTLVETRVRESGIEDQRIVDPENVEQWPARYRVTVDATLSDGTTQELVLYTNRGAIGTGIPDLDVSRLPEDSRDLVLDEVGQVANGDVAARARKKIVSTAQFLAGFGTDADPLAPYRGKRNMVVGFGDSGFVTVAALKGALSAPDSASTTYNRRQLGDVGPVEFVTGKSGPNSQFEFAQLFDIDQAKLKELAKSFGYDVQIQEVPPRRGAPPDAPKIIRFRYVDIGGLARERENDVQFNASNVVRIENGESDTVDVFVNSKEADAALRRFVRREGAARRFEGQFFDDPVTGREYEIIEDASGKLVPVEVINVDNLILATGQKTNSGKLLSEILPTGTDPYAPLERNDAAAPIVKGEVEGFDEPVNIGRRIAGQDWALIGPSTGNIVPRELLANQKENVASLFNLIPRSTAVGALLGNEALAAPVTRNIDSLITPRDTVGDRVYLRENEFAEPNFGSIEFEETPQAQLEARPPNQLELFRMKFNLAQLLGDLEYPAGTEGGEMKVRVTQERIDDEGGVLNIESKNLDSESIDRLVGEIEARPDLVNLLQNATNVERSGLEFTLPIGQNRRIVPEQITVTPYNDWNFFS